MELSSVLIAPAAVTAREEGTWVRDIVQIPGLHLLVRGMSSRKASSLRDSKIRRVPRKQRDQDGQINSEVLEKIGVDVLAEGVLLGWNLTQDGEPVPFTVETARKIMSDPSGTDFVAAVIEAARSVDQIRGENIEAIEKNS